MSSISSEMCNWSCLDRENIRVTTTPSTGARYVPDMMEVQSQKAIVTALERLYSSDKLSQVWPAAYDYQRRNNCPIPLADIDIVVLPLDRIGAPAGASGAQVFVSYFSNRPAGGIPQLLGSPPLVVKVGSRDKLKPEVDIKTFWPTLSSELESHFAKPIHLDTTFPDTAVFIAPFHSEYKLDDDGVRANVRLRDLWKLLHNVNEMRPDPETPVDWSEIKRYVGHALDTVKHVHRDNEAQYKRLRATYSHAYARYLRDTYPINGAGKRSHLPLQLFGRDSTVAAFGRQWPNPFYVIEELMNPLTKFEGTFGPVHGDLHPKNIVIGHGDSVQIIDFGWAQPKAHVVVDYLLLDINIRGTTLPSQVTETHMLRLAQFLQPGQDICTIDNCLQPRARLIEDAIWSRCTVDTVIKDWRREYVTPFFLVAYGLLVYLDDARNQSALLASVLAAAELIQSAKK